MTARDRRLHLRAARAGLTAVALVLAATSAIPASWVPAKIQVEILTRVLESDRALGARAGGGVTIGLLFEEGRPSSRNLELLEAFRSLEGRRVSGLDVSVVQRSFRSDEDLALWLEEEGIDLVYIAPGLADQSDPIRIRCREMKVVGVTGERKLVERGLALGIVGHGNRPHVVVNLPIAKAAGMEIEDAVLERFELLR